MPDTTPMNPTYTQMLDAVPTRNVRVMTERHGEELLLKAPVKPRWFLTNPVSRAILPQKKYYKVALDAVGREVWDACDGRNTVEQIAERFAQRHRLRFHEARMSVSHFLRSLTERGCIVIVVPEDDGRKPRAKSTSMDMERSPESSRRDIRRSAKLPVVAMEGMS